MMLGLRADVPRKTLFVDPTLPRWLSDIELPNLKVGETRLHLRFRRLPDGTSEHEVIGQQGEEIAVCRESWWEADEGSRH